jgi:hypothetical protein
MIVGRLLAVLAIVAGLASCDAGETKIIGADFPAAACAVTPAAPPASLGAAPFYGKVLDANGIPVLSSAEVSDAALVSACVIVVRMAGARDDVRRTMIGQGMRVVVLARGEVTTDVPEYSDLYTTFPTGRWDELRGVGATLATPVSSAGEENLLCLPNDKYAGRTIMVQTFATAMLLGLEATDAAFAARLQAAYDAAMAAGLWRDTFAAANPIEYYVEGVEDWFEADIEASPADGTHNEINTRAELRAHDPALADLVAESMPDDGWRPGCR